jgi:hypothetical protein
MNSALLASCLTAPLVALTAAGVHGFSGEGRLDSYAFGSLAVIAANAALVDALPRVRRRVARQLGAVAGVMALPFVAGGVTGTMLALVHPRYPANEFATRPSFPGLLLGGATRGLAGAVMTYPALLPAAALVFGITWAVHARLARPAETPAPPEPALRR